MLKNYLTKFPMEAVGKPLPWFGNISLSQSSIQELSGICVFDFISNHLFSILVNNESDQIYRNTAGNILSSLVKSFGLYPPSLLSQLLLQATEYLSTNSQLSQVLYLNFTIGPF